MAPLLLLAPPVPTVDFVETAPLSRLLPHLARATGEAVASSATVDADVVTVAVKGADREALFRKIAEVVGGTWRKESGGVRRLYRTPDQQRTQAAAVRAKRIEGFRTQIAKRLKEREAQGEFDAEKANALAARMEGIVRSFQPNSMSGDSWERISKATAEAPVGRAVSALLPALDPAALADLEEQSRLVLSDRPTPSQYPLPKGVRPVLEQLVREQAIWAKAAARRTLQPPQRGNMRYSLGGATEALQPFDGDLDKCLLIVRSWGGGGVQLELQLADRKGKIIGTASDSIGSMDWREIYKDLQAKPEEKDGPKIVPDAAALAFLRMGNLRMGDKAGEPPPEMRRLLADPVGHDPLDLAAGSGLAQYAAKMDRDVVAFLSDTVPSVYDWQVADAPPEKWAIPAASLPRRLRWMYETQEDGTWLTLAPRDPVEARKKRTPRDLLALIANAPLSNDPLDLEPRAALAWRLRNLERQPLASRYFQAYRSKDGYSGIEQKGLQLYGGLDERQRALAKRGELKFSALSDEQAEVVRRLVYGPYVWLQYQPEPNENFEWDAWYNGIRKDPTECMPNGIPADAKIEIRDVTQDCIEFGPRKSPEGHDYGSYPQPVDQAANDLYYQSRPDVFPWAVGEWRPDTKKARALRQRQVTVEFKLVPKISVSDSFEGRDYAGPLGPIESLPVAIRQRLARATEKLKEQYKDAKPGMYGGPASQGNGAIPPG